MSKLKSLLIKIRSNIEIRTEIIKKRDYCVKRDNLVILLDTSIDSDNIGDQIIMYFAERLLRPMLTEYKIVRVATHNYPSEKEIELMLKARCVIVCGTNILSPQMELYTGWKFNAKQIHLNNVVLMGVGWWGYKKTSMYSKFVYKNIFEKNCLQSVRDSQTENELRKIGVTNVINTNCLTLWDLDENCTDIPIRKCNTVVFTVTGVYKDVFHDRLMLSILKNNYEKIVFWPQGIGDLQYYQEYLYDEKIEVLDETLDAITCFLNKTETDYIGSRLHGGIYALHFNKRTIVIAVDNRAIEIGRDTHLPVIRIENIVDELQKKIRSEWETKLVLNKKNVIKWMDSLRNVLKN